MKNAMTSACDSTTGGAACVHRADASLLQASNGNSVDGQSGDMHELTAVSVGQR